MPGYEQPRHVSAYHQRAGHFTGSVRAHDSPDQPAGSTSTPTAGVVRQREEDSHEAEDGSDDYGEHHERYEGERDGGEERDQDRDDRGRYEAEHGEGGRVESREHDGDRDRERDHGREESSERHSERDDD